MTTAPPNIFSPRRRAQARDRAATRFEEHDFLYQHMADGLLDRLADVSRKFDHALIVGAPNRTLIDALAAQGMAVTVMDPGAVNAESAKGIQGQEDEPHFADDSFDLILACGTLDTVNDLPGALVLMRRALKPDGLMLAAFVGSGSLPLLRRALLIGDGDRPSQRVHPFVDVRAAGDLLSRAGYAMPVADQDMLTVRYANILSLMQDLRGMGAGNCLASPPPPLTRRAIEDTAAAFADRADADGRVSESFAIIHLSGWKPAPDQPKPARRGSAGMSLAEALKDRS